MVPGESKPNILDRTSVALGLTEQPSATSATGQSSKRKSIVFDVKSKFSMTVHVKISGMFDGAMVSGNFQM